MLGASIIENNTKGTHWDKRFVPLAEKLGRDAFILALHMCVRQRTPLKKQAAALYLLQKVYVPRKVYGKCECGGTLRYTTGIAHQPSKYLPCSTTRFAVKCDKCGKETKSRHFVLDATNCDFAVTSCPKCKKADKLKTFVDSNHHVLAPHGGYQVEDVESTICMRCKRVFFSPKQGEEYEVKAAQAELRYLEKGLEV